MLMGWRKLWEVWWGIPSMLMRWGRSWGSGKGYTLHVIEVVVVKDDENEMMVCGCDVLYAM